MIEQAQKHILAGEFEKAESLYREMLADSPENPELLYLLAIALKRQDKREEEFDYLQQAYAISPGERFVLHGLGNAYLHQKDFDKAIEYFDKEVRVNPNFPQGHAALAYTHLRQGNWQQAEQFARTALRSREEHPPTMVILAAALLELGQADKAVNYYQRVVELDPDNGVAMEGLARAFLLNGQAAFAAQCCHNALKLDPGQESILGLLGKAEEAQQNWRYAAEAYAMALDASPENLACLSGLARVLSSLGQAQQAESLYKRLLRLNPQLHTERLQLCNLFIKQGKYNKVLSSLRPLLSLPADYPERLSALIIAAKVLLHEGKVEMAVEALQPGLSAANADPQAQLMYAQILAQQNQIEKAAAQLAPLVKTNYAPVRARLMAVRLWTSIGGEAGLALALEQLEKLEQQGQMTEADAHKEKALRIRVLHGLGQYSEAMTIASKTKREVARIADLSLDLEDSGFEMPSAEIFSQLPKEPIVDRRTEPTFILAWPGTGRQKLLSALQAHPEVTVANDANNKQQKRLDILLRKVDNLALEDMTETDIRLARKRYWRLLEQSLPDWTEIRQVVDALWLPVEALPMLYRLFPAAQIVSVQRDIADLELSWKLHGYQDIETMTSQWSRQSQLCLQAQDLVPLQFSKLDWGQLELDPEAGLKHLFMELNLSWDADILNAFNYAQAPMVFPAGDWKHYQEVEA